MRTLHGTVRAAGEGNARVQEGAERIGPRGALGAQTLRGPEVGRDELRLNRGRHPEAPHPFCLLGVDHRCVLDARWGTLIASLLCGPEEGFHGPVSDGVNDRSQARAMRYAKAADEFLFIQEQKAVGGGLIGIRLAEGGGSGAERSIGERLHPGSSQQVVIFGEILAPFDTCDVGVDPGEGDHHLDADGEFAPLPEFGQSRDLLPTPDDDVGSRKARTIVDGARVPRGREPFIESGIADCIPDRSHGVFGQQAVRRDDSGPPEGFAVGHQRVPADPRNHDGSVRKGRVQLLSRGIAPLFKALLIECPTQKPFAGGLFDLQPEAIHDIVDRCSVPQIGGAGLLDPEAHEVTVSVGQARQDCPATEVEGFIRGRQATRKFAPIPDGFDMTAEGLVVGNDR